MQTLKTIKQVNSWRKVLPMLMVLIRRRNRYLPDFTWTVGSWVANFFRFYELVFWRDFDIRREAFASSHLDEQGRTITTYQYCSLEAMLCHIEQVLRQAFKFKFRLPVKIWIPLLSNPMGLPMPASPFLFAIAYDNSGSGLDDSGTASSVTAAFTASGSNSLILTYGILVTNGSNTITINSFTWNGNTMTAQYSNYFLAVGLQRSLAYYSYLNGTADGLSHNIVMTASANVRIGYVVASYSGVSQTAFPDAKNKTDSSAGSATSASVAVTTTVNNCWLTSGIYSDATPSASTNTTLRTNGSSPPTGRAMGDSNGPQSPAGSYSQAYTFTASSYSLAVLSIAPIPFNASSNFLAFFN